MRATIILYFISIITADLYSQNHDYHWLAGYRESSLGDSTISDISFNSNPPYVTKRKSNFSGFQNYAAFCSDSSGQNLLFFTNGSHIYSSNGEITQGGDTINPTNYWRDENGLGGLCHTSFAFPDPGLPNHYYLIHTGFEYDSLISDLAISTLYYSRIDMAANNGLGKVVAKNVVLTSGALTRPVVIKHGNGRDWWVISGSLNSAYVLKFLFTKDGIQGPWIQNLGFLFSGALDRFPNSIFTPDGSTYIREYDKQGIVLQGFDRCSGEFSNTRILPYESPINTWSIAVSVDSRYLYLNGTTALMMLDLKGGLYMHQTFDTVALYDGHSELGIFSNTFFVSCLGPDGKIYFSSTNSTNYYHVINRGQLPEMSCDFEQVGFDLQNWNGYTLPGYINYRLGKQAGSPCAMIQSGTETVQKEDMGAAIPYQMLEGIGNKQPENEPLLNPLKVIDIKATDVGIEPNLYKSYRLKY
jgi:hypothetical protein